VKTVATISATDPDPKAIPVAALAVRLSATGV
jgi:hypothetical protein